MLTSVFFLQLCACGFSVNAKNECEDAACAHALPQQQQTGKVTNLVQKQRQKTSFYDKTSDESMEADVDGDGVAAAPSPARIDMANIKQKDHVAPASNFFLTKETTASFPMSQNTFSLLQQRQQKETHQFCFDIVDPIPGEEEDADGEKHLHSLNFFLDGTNYSLMNAGQEDWEPGSYCCRGSPPSDTDPARMSHCCGKPAGSLIQLPDMILNVDVTEKDETSIADAARQIAQFAREKRTNTTIFFEKDNQPLMERVELLLQNVPGVTLMEKSDKVCGTGLCIAATILIVAALPVAGQIALESAYLGIVHQAPHPLFSGGWR